MGWYRHGSHNRVGRWGALYSTGEDIDPRSKPQDPGRLSPYGLTDQHMQECTAYAGWQHGAVEAIPRPQVSPAIQRAPTFTSMMPGYRTNLGDVESRRAEQHGGGTRVYRRR